MDKFLGKLSLYDIVTMIIPGGTILLFYQILMLDVEFSMNEISLIFKDSSAINEISIKRLGFWTGQNIVVGLVLSYIVGIINHLLSAKLWASFRNDPIMIKSKFNEVANGMPISYNLVKLYYSSKEKESEKNIINDCVCASLWLLVAVWFVSQMFVSFSKMWSNNESTLLFNVDIIIIGLINFAYPLFYTKKDDKILLDAYYEAYYFVAQKSKAFNVPFIESQVSFLQSMLLPLTLLLCLPNCGIERVFGLFLGVNESYNIFLLKIPFMVLWACIIPAVYSRQNKIYELVWYDYEYLKRLEK